MQDQCKEILNEIKKLNQNLKKLVLRNNVLVHLSLKEPSEKQKLTTRQHISLLSSMGFDYKEIAEIFGKSKGYISSELTQINKKYREEQNKNKEFENTEGKRK